MQITTSPNFYRIMCLINTYLDMSICQFWLHFPFQLHFWQLLWFNKRYIFTKLSQIIYVVDKHKVYRLLNVLLLLVGKKMGSMPLFQIKVKYYLNQRLKFYKWGIKMFKKGQALLQSEKIVKFLFYHNVFVSQKASFFRIFKSIN